MRIYNYDENKFFTTEEEAFVNPLEGGYLIPPNATSKPVCEFNKETQICKLINDDWIIFEKENQEEAVIEAAFSELKVAKSNEIKYYFTQEIEHTGHLTSTIDNFEIDARRVDKQNIDGLIEIYFKPINYVGYETIRPNTSKEDLMTFRKELIMRANDLYAKKWLLEKQIAEATTKEGLEAITWN